MANFNLVVPTLDIIEGGFQKLANDKGNYNSLGQLVGTNHGVSAPVYENWINRVPSEYDMRNMSKDTSLQIMKLLYWDKIKANEINEQAVAEMLFDHAINRGAYPTVILLQTLLKKEFNKNIAIDGVIGPMTLMALNSVFWKDLFYQVSRYRKADYEGLNNSFFLENWLNRIKTIAQKFSVDISKVFTENKSSIMTVGSVIFISTIVAYYYLKP